MEDQPNRVSSSGAPLYVPPGIRVLVVDDDRTSLMNVDKALSSASYKVITCESAIVALDMLRGERSKFDIVVTDVHMPEMDGFMLLERIKLEMDIPVVMLSADANPSVILRGLKQGACYFFTKPVPADDIKNIWQYVIQRRRTIDVKKIEQTGSVEVNDEEEDNEERRIEKALEEIECASSDNGGELGRSKRKKDSGEYNTDSCSTEVNVEESSTRKTRLVWDSALHGLFLRAISEIGVEKAVPKNILEAMNVPGLTRTHIASHLQKYRMYIRKVDDPRPEPLKSSDITGFNRTFPSYTPTYMNQHNAASLPFYCNNGAALSPSKPNPYWSGILYKNEPKLYFGGTSSLERRPTPVLERFDGIPADARGMSIQSNIRSWNASREIPSMPTLNDQNQATVVPFTMDSNESFTTPLLNDYPHTYSGTRESTETHGTYWSSNPSYNCTTNLTLHPSRDGGFMGLISSGSLSSPTRGPDTDLNFLSGWVPGSQLIETETNAPPFPDFSSSSLRDGHGMDSAGQMPVSNLLPENFLALIQRTHDAVHITEENVAEALPNSSAIETNSIPSEFTDADLEELVSNGLMPQHHEHDHIARSAGNRSAPAS